jgi:hypothetical protein
MLLSEQVNLRRTSKDMQRATSIAVTAITAGGHKRNQNVPQCDGRFATRRRLGAPSIAERRSFMDEPGRRNQNPVGWLT